MLSLEQFLSEFTPAPPASLRKVMGVEKAANVRLPESYKEFLTHADGGCGFVGDNHIVLWPTHQLEEFNREYDVGTYAPGFFLIGSNGGGEAYAIDLKSRLGPVVLVPFIGMDRSEALLISHSFLGFFHDLFQFEISKAVHYEGR